MQIAVVGAGAAGFYAAQHIAKARPDCQIDMFEKLPVPYGLVRYGVAPDHPEVKNCISTFNKTAQLSNVRFFGNVSLGKDFHLDELRRCYHCVLLSYGAEQDRELGIPGEHLHNVIAARSLVSLYNGLPGYQDLEVNLDTDTAVVVGIGNVAMDVARMLLSPIDELRKFDTAESWLERRLNSRVRRVVLVGRRGPLHVSFTIKEFREILKQDGTRTVLHPDQFIPVKDLLESLDRKHKRLVGLLVTTALEPSDPSRAERWSKAENTFELKLFRSPLEFLPGGDGQSVGSVKLAINQPQGNGVVQTDQTEEIKTGLVLRSIGYKSVRVDPRIPFDDKKGIVPNTDGRVEEGLYAVGWLGTGPRGIIVDTMNFAFKVGSRIVEDLKNMPESKPGFEGMPKLPLSTSWEDWIKINQWEESAGRLKDKPREKIVCVEQMLKTIRS